MSHPQSFDSFRDPAFSLWQAAVHGTLLKHAKQGKAKLTKDARGVAKTSDHPYMGSTVDAIHDLKNSVRPTPKTMQGKPHPEDVRQCARLAARMAWAEVFDRDNLQQIKDEFKNSVCDPFWTECYAEYEWMVHSGNGSQPYTDYGNDISKFIVDGCFGDKATLAIISDWGTGTNDALVLLRQIAANFKPDVLIHLGDIYYAGLPDECTEHFTALIAEVWPQNPPLVYALSGNHDRYAGNKGGYFPMIAGLNRGTRFGQPSSYFCLRNDYWQFCAMDTGINDTNPWTEYKNLTCLRDTEVAWHLDKIQGNGAGVDKPKNPSGARGTVMLSHHQLMSFVGVGRDDKQRLLAVNPHLAEAFQPVFGMIDAWLWGHEHDLLLFQPYTMSEGVALPPGRCVGAGAIPVFPPEPEAQTELVVPQSEQGPPAIIPGTQLGDNGTVFNHAYAMVSLDGPGMTIDYYQLDSSGANPKRPPRLSKIAYSDRIAKPLVAGGHGIGASSRGLWAWLWAKVSR